MGYGWNLRPSFLKTGELGLQPQKQKRNETKNIMTYASSLALGRQRGYASRNQNNTAFQRSGRAIGPVSNTIILIVLACLLGLLYLTQVTKTNAYGYELSELEAEHAVLMEEHGELEVAAARLQAPERAEKSEVAQNMVSAAPRGTVR